ncbi:hypothetical protein ACFQ3S_02905 [Mucilaginibacter terrae]|uniref:hypothetical protein n=1 Tax=Mucilaginibacter terrae TaxID=1955052 RepID=UPI00362F3806
MKTIKTAYKRVALLLAGLSLLSACQSSSQSGTEADTTNAKVKKGKISKRTQDGCYLQVSGKQMKDTLYVQLHIQNNKVSGKMVSSIFEKDSRKGTLTGNMRADKTIQATWIFMQEGMTDSIPVSFKLNHTGLYQKPLKADVTTGREFTDMTAPFSIELKPTDCNK